MLESIETPPLSVQTLVENSLKYAIAPRREGGEISVVARRVEGRVIIEVTDDGPGFASSAIRSGHGLDNLQSRLAALYDNRAALDIARTGEGATVSISLPQTEAIATVTA
jgi:LytS/YehU family sensor histidine kinase